jgi:transposase
MHQSRTLYLGMAVHQDAIVDSPTRFDTPRQLPNDLGLLHAESASGERRRQGSITTAGQTHVRRALVEGAWASRHPANVSRHWPHQRKQLPKPIQDISGKAQVRLCKRFRAAPL